MRLYSVGVYLILSERARSLEPSSLGIVYICLSLRAGL